ncbi:unnamed protein product [Mytilus edulis]|uniref:Ig-like domain-containing protein n=1 Tax=Mytilus edulis TaxID=6550 RepID=A0A8S3Q667_MYTED|nr:unnamed protein product [Mytilus edulis]
MYSYGQLLQTVFLFLLSFPHGTSTDISNGSVFWTLKTIPAVFGNDVQLQCHVGPETTGKNRARQWSGGKDQKLLIFNGNSTNYDKYTEAYHETLKISVLTIKKFEIDDVNIKYVCQQGFSTYSNTLKLMPDIFQYIPRRIGTVISQEAGQISITFDRVYPVPSCTALLGKQNITDKVKIVTIPNESIYQSQISISYSQFSEESLPHQIDLVCLVGTKEIKQSFKIQSKGKIEQKLKDQTLGEFGRGVFATVFACTLIAFIVPLLNGWFPAS